MKHALVNGQLTPATPDAPVLATCPNCGDQVKLRNRQGTYFWRHVELPREGCPPPQSNLWTRRVGDFVVELHFAGPEGHHLKLRSLSAGEAGERSGLVVGLGEVRPLSEALLEAVAEADHLLYDLEEAEEDTAKT
jgi:hypothetical protein